MAGLTIVKIEIAVALLAASINGFLSIHVDFYVFETFMLSKCLLLLYSHHGDL